GLGVEVEQDRDARFRRYDIPPTRTAAEIRRVGSPVQPGDPARPCWSVPALTTATGGGVQAVEVGAVAGGAGLLAPCA
ncbi:hypothetical protein ACW9HR_38000, partial [Nocardia gipuzkoensis]